MKTSSRSDSARSARRRAFLSDAVPRLPLICFSHRGWGDVWQRPQHILTRISHTHPVYFVEEPALCGAGFLPRLDTRTDHGVTVLTPVLPGEGVEPLGFSTTTNARVRDLLTSYFADEFEETDVVAWYTTPMAYGALPETLNSAATVYDVMDEPSSISESAVEFGARDRRLMQEASLLFSSGPSLHESRKYRHPRAFCFPSGVEVHHFRDVSGPVPDDIAGFESPLIGYYGMVDERIDIELLVHIAEVRPEWNLLMIGPVAASLQNRLPKRPNIHYLGRRSYADLPHYLARFDAAILPYALTDATRYISPTKTLEYLAGGKPVVSTPIRDVVDLYGDVVEFGETPHEFIGAIEMLWNESAVERAFRRQLANTVLAEHNWDVIASRMLRLIHDVLAGRSTLEKVIAGSLFRSAPSFHPLVPRTAK